MSEHLEYYPDKRSEHFQLQDERFCGKELAPLNDSDALYVLRSLTLSSFENALNAVEHFLSHLEITDSSETFAAAAAWLDNLIADFSELDEDADGRLTHEELAHWSKTLAENWIDCHFDALCRSDIVAAQSHSLTLRALENARGIFHGLAYVQQHLSEMLAFARGKQFVLDSQSIRLYLDLKRSRLSLTESMGLLALANYLARLETKDRRERARRLDLQNLDSITPEALWTTSA